MKNSPITPQQRQHRREAEKPRAGEPRRLAVRLYVERNDEAKPATVGAAMTHKCIARLRMALREQVRARCERFLMPEVAPHCAPRVAGEIR